jgi:hypothetical protein
MGEEAIYIQQKSLTGGVESARSREISLESMYSWLGRISSTIYSNIQDSLNNFALLNGTGFVTVNKPMSFAILNELDAFDYLNTIVNTDAPVFIKTTHIENFLNKYISKTSVVLKVVDILKRVDPFVFYTMKDLQTLSDSGVINDSDWRIHAYAFPLLMMMYSNDPEIMEQDYKVIQAELMRQINNKFNNPLVPNNNSQIDYQQAAPPPPPPPMSPDDPNNIDNDQNEGSGTSNGLPNPIDGTIMM